jgi:hypothetical protein
LQDTGVPASDALEPYDGGPFCVAESPNPNLFCDDFNNQSTFLKTWTRLEQGPTYGPVYDGTNFLSPAGSFKAQLGDTSAARGCVTAGAAIDFPPLYFHKTRINVWLRASELGNTKPTQHTVATQEISYETNNPWCAMLTELRWDGTRYELVLEEQLGQSGVVPESFLTPTGIFVAEATWFHLEVEVDQTGISWYRVGGGAPIRLPIIYGCPGLLTNARARLGFYCSPPAPEHAEMNAEDFVFEAE